MLSTMPANVGAVHAKKIDGNKTDVERSTPLSVSSTPRLGTENVPNVVVLGDE